MEANFDPCATKNSVSRQWLERVLHTNLYPLQPIQSGAILEFNITGSATRFRSFHSIDDYSEKAIVSITFCPNRAPTDPTTLSLFETEINKCAHIAPPVSTNASKIGRLGQRRTYTWPLVRIGLLQHSETESHDQSSGSPASDHRSGQVVDLGVLHLYECTRWYHVTEADTDENPASPCKADMIERKSIKLLQLFYHQEPGKSI
jgi:hypothetical protein